MSFFLHADSRLSHFLFGPKLLHSLRRQFSFVLAMLAIMVSAYGLTAIYALNQSRTATRQLAEQQLTRLQASHDLVWQILNAAALADTLTRTVSSEQAHLHYDELVAQLKQIEVLVDQLSGGDNDLNVLDLQYSNQLFNATASAVVQQRGMLSAAHTQFEQAYRQSHALLSSRPYGANVNARLILEVLQNTTSATTVRQLRTSMGNLPGSIAPWAGPAGDPFALRLTELERQTAIDLLQDALHQHELNIMASTREQSDYFARDYRDSVLRLAVATTRRQQWVFVMLSVSLLLLWLIGYHFIGRHVLGRMRMVSRYLRFDRPHGTDEIERRVPVTGNDEIADMARALERFLEDRNQLQLARQQLEEGQSRLAAIIEHAADGFVIVQDGLIRQINPAARNLLEWQPGGSPMLALIELVRHSGPPLQVDTLAYTPAGRSIPVEVSASEVTLLSGPNVILVVRDATVRRETERQLTYARDAAEAARAAQAAFLSNMSHEFRTPLNAILGYTQILLNSDDLSEKRRRGIETIEQSGQHLLELVNDILDLAQIEANRLELHVARIELGDFLRVIGDIVTIRSEQKGLEFRRDWDTVLPSIEADEKRLRQILLNLLGNAVKFTQGGHVCLRALWHPVEMQTNRGVLRLEIEDSGVGIAEADLPHIFERFTQVGEIQHRAGGTGLGLAICGQLLALMGSSLQVRSQIGAGSIFWFDLEVTYFAPDIGDARSKHNVAPVASAIQPLPDAAAVIDAPPAADLTALLELVRAGDMQQVGDYAAALSQRDARYQPFAEPLIRLAADLRAKAVSQYIRKFINREQP